MDCDLLICNGPYYWIDLVTSNVHGKLSIIPYFNCETKLYTLKNLKWTGMAIPFWVRIYVICFLSEMYSIMIGSPPVILSRNGKPIAAVIEWNFHSQIKYQYWECTRGSSGEEEVPVYEYTPFTSVSLCVVDDQLEVRFWDSDYGNYAYREEDNTRVYNRSLKDLLNSLYIRPGGLGVAWMMG